MMIRRSGIRQEARAAGVALAKAAGIVLLAGTLSGPSFGADSSGSGHQLNPGVRPGDVVILRRVESAPVNRVKRHAGPITSRVNARDAVIGTQQRISGITAVSLTDERAAGVRGSVQGSMNSLHRTLGTNGQPRNGGAAGGASNRAASGLGGG
ncbi:MAG TPA: hypothetical protein VK991_12695, partial [Halomonas sp.]|nr:hypothetical protein [Halomonas sp.]